MNNTTIIILAIVSLAIITGAAVFTRTDSAKTQAVLMDYCIKNGFSEYVVQYDPMLFECQNKVGDIIDATSTEL